MPIPLRDPNQPIPTLPNEQGQMPPAGVPPAPQQAPPPPAPAAPRPGRGKGKKQVEEVAAPKNKKKAGAQAGGSGPIARQDSQNWASDVLKGQFETNPWIKALMDPAALDVRNNPNLQPVIEGIKSELQEDWLGNLRALDAKAESIGRGGGGSPLAGAMRTRATEETQEAAANAISNVLAGAYENERNRQMQGLGLSLQAQAQAAGIPIEWFNADTGRKSVNVQRQIGMGQLANDRRRIGLQSRELAFNQKMATQAAQQDALNDYMGLLAMLGGMGGTQSGGGQYIPSQSPWAAAALGGLGGYMVGEEAFG